MIASGYSERQKRSLGVAVCAVLTAAATVAGAGLPALSYNGTMSDSLLEGGGAPLVVMTLVLAAAPLLGAARLRWADGPGIAGGAALIGTVWHLLLLSIFRLFFGFGVTAGPGFVLLCIAALLGGITFIWSLAARERGVAIPVGLAIAGCVFAGLTTLGLMLPPPDSYIGFVDRNFPGGDAFFQVAYLLFVGGFGLAGVLGFATRSRWGWGFALGSWLPLAWLVISAVFEVGEPSAWSDVSRVLREEVHPLLPIACAVELGLLLVALVGFTTRLAVPAGFGPAPWPPASMPPPPPPPAPGGGARPAPVGGPNPEPAPTRPPPAASYRAEPAPPPRPVGRRVLVVSDGRRIPLADVVVVGRDPVAGPDDGPAERLVLAGTERLVSKTHAAFGTTGDLVWLEDRHSTNGVQLADENGSWVTVPPGERVPLQPGSRVLVGGTEIVYRVDEGSAGQTWP